MGFKILVEIITLLIFNSLLYSMADKESESHFPD